MKIGIDLSPAEHDPAGIGQYAISLFSELCKLDRKNSYFVYTTSPFRFAGAENIHIKPAQHLPLKGIRWMQAVSKDAQTRDLDLFISPTNHLFSKLFPRTIQFIHDLAPVYYPEFFGKKAAFKYGQTAKIAVKNSVKILTISQTVKQELLEKYRLAENFVDFVYPGLNSWIQMSPKDKNAVLEKYNLDFDYILTLSTLEPRKNHVNMLKAFKQFKTKTLSPLKFVIIGKKGWYYEQIFKTVSELHLEKEVVFLGYVSNQDLNPIFTNAKAFLFMSFYEGFGIPPIEALSMNIPTLVSDIPVFKEAYEDKANYTEPEDFAKIAVALKKLLDSPTKHTSEFVRHKFSWEKSANKMLTILDEFK